MCFFGLFHFLALHGKQKDQATRYQDAPKDAFWNALSLHYIQKTTIQTTQFLDGAATYLQPLDQDGSILTWNLTASAKAAKDEDAAPVRWRMLSKGCFLKVCQGAYKAPKVAKRVKGGGGA